MAAGKTQSETVITGTSAERLALDVSGLEFGTTFKESDTGNEYELYGATWYQVTADGSIKTSNQSIGAGARNPSSTTESYLVVREECNLTIIDIQTAVTIGGGVANDTHLMGVMINVALTGTCVITGFEGSAGTAISITLPAATPAGFIDFKGAINSIGALTVTCSNVADDNDVQILWKAA